MVAGSEGVAVVGIHDPRSIGIERYVTRLAETLVEAGVNYAVAARADAGAVAHFHFGNSTRSIIPRAALRRKRMVVTVHDVIPRTRALLPAYRSAVYPAILRGATAVVVHSEFAAGMLAGVAGIARSRISVIAPGANLASPLGRDDARSRSGLPPGPPLFVLPGVIKPAKLVEEAIAAATPLIAQGRMRLTLAGAVADPVLVQAARRAGVDVIADPVSERYDALICAADAVVVLRRDAVGETNGPLLDAFAAGRPVLANPVGSIPETMGDGGLLVSADVDAIRAGFEELLQPRRLETLERAARRRGQRLTWRSAAEAHAVLFAEAARA